MVTDNKDGSGARVLLDPNTLSKDGTISLVQWVPSEDGARVVYALAEAGSDWESWHVREVASGKDLADEIRWSKFGNAAWRKDGSGFFYSAYDAPKAGAALTGVVKFQKIYFHAIGTAQSADALIMSAPDKPDWGFSADVSEDGHFLAIFQSEGTEPKNRIFLLDLTKKDAKPEAFLDKFDASYEIIGNDGDTFYVLTDRGAPKYQLLAITRGKGERVVVAQSPKDVLSTATMVGDHVFVVWKRDAHEVSEIFGKDGARQGSVTMPSDAPGLIGAFNARRRDSDLFFGFTTFTAPTAVYRYDLAAKKVSVWHAAKLTFDPSRFVAEEVFFTSKDGTRVPMFVVSKKGLVKDGNNPTLLYGYGGFNISLGPVYSPAITDWLEMGGVYAEACLRVGGEYGKAWHDAGRLAQKQNVFDDAIAAAQWLITNKYTQSSKLAVNGGSNGGLLVGALVTQRPDLFGAALAQVGVMDMLRFHKFTIGWAWKSDYGSSEDKAGFDVLYKYSPLHNIKAGTKYPATLVLTGDHDDRVVPAHSHKFTATLQAAQGGAAPVLTRIETRAGHGAGKPVTMQIEERADMWAFLVKNLGVKL